MLNTNAYLPADLTCPEGVGSTVDAPRPVKAHIIAGTLLGNGTGVNAGQMHYLGAAIPRLITRRPWFVDNAFGLAGDGGETVVTVSDGAFERNDVEVLEFAFGTSDRLDLSTTAFDDNSDGPICSSATCNSARTSSPATRWPSRPIPHSSVFINFSTAAVASWTTC